MVDIEGLIALTIVFSIPILGLGIAFLAIYLDYKKKLAMIEKGLVPEDEKYRPENRLGWGIAILGIGIALILSWMFHLNDIAMIGLIFTSIGIALLVAKKGNI